jgi:hypothetical protein
MDEEWLSIVAAPVGDDQQVGERHERAEADASGEGPAFAPQAEENQTEHEVAGAQGSHVAERGRVVAGGQAVAP